MSTSACPVPELVKVNRAAVAGLTPGVHWCFGFKHQLTKSLRETAPGANAGCYGAIHYDMLG